MYFSPIFPTFLITLRTISKQKKIQRVLLHEEKKKKRKKKGRTRIAWKLIRDRWWKLRENIPVTLSYACFFEKSRTRKRESNLGENFRETMRSKNGIRIIETRALQECRLDCNFGMEPVPPTKLNFIYPLPLLSYRSSKFTC